MSYNEGSISNQLKTPQSVVMDIIHAESETHTASSPDDVKDFDPQTLGPANTTPESFVTTIEIRQDLHKQCDKCKIFYPSSKPGCQNQACPLFIGRKTPLKVTPLPNQCISVTITPNSQHKDEKNKTPLPTIPVIPLVNTSENQNSVEIPMFHPNKPFTREQLSDLIMKSLSPTSPQNVVINKDDSTSRINIDRRNSGTSQNLQVPEEYGYIDGHNKEEIPNNFSSPVNIDKINVNSNKRSSRVPVEIITRKDIFDDSESIYARSPVLSFSAQKVNQIPTIKIDTDGKVSSSPIHITSRDQSKTNNFHIQSKENRDYVYVDPVNGSDESDSLSMYLPYKSIYVALTKVTDMTILVLSPGNYTQVKFKNITIRGHSQETQLSNITTENCSFENVNIKDLNVTGTNYFNKVTFEDKMAQINCVGLCDLIFENTLFDIEYDNLKNNGVQNNFINTDGENISIKITNSNIKSNIPFICSKGIIDLKVNQSFLDLKRYLLICHKINCQIDIKYCTIINNRHLIKMSTSTLHMAFTTLNSSTTKYVFSMSGGEAVFDNCVLTGKIVNMFNNKIESPNGYFSGTIRPKTTVTIPDSFNLYTFTQSNTRSLISSGPTLLDEKVKEYTTKKTDKTIIYHDKGLSRQIILINLDTDSEIGSEVYIKHAGSRHNSQICVISKLPIDGICNAHTKSQFLSPNISKTYVFQGETGWVTKS
jgi:hypothetical protein